MNNSNLNSAIIESIRSENIVDIATDNIEVALDMLLSDGPIKDIPVLGNIVKVIGIFKNVSDVLFLKKLTKILIELKSCTQQKRDELIKRLSKFRGSEQKIGETILMIVDRLDDLQKPTIIGKLFLLCAEGKISEAELFRLCNIVERTYFADLLALNKIIIKQSFSNDDMSLYATVGLAIPKLMGLSSPISGVYAGGVAVRTGKEPTLEFKFTPSAYTLAEIVHQISI